MKKIVFIIIGVIVLAIILFSAFKGNKKGKGIDSETKLEIAVVKKDTITATLEEIGEIKPEKVIEVKSKVSGKISKMYVEEGDRIKEGDIIAEIEPDMNQARTISSIKSNLKLASINLQSAQDNYNAQKKLYENGFISEDDLKKFSDNLEKAKIDHQSALEQYELVKETGITEEELKIIAPASGTIIEKKIEQGEMVVSGGSSFSGGTIILSIADISKMIIETGINELDIGKVELNQPVEINVSAFPDVKYKGKITHISPMAKNENNIRIFDIKIAILNQDERLKPGMTANISISGKCRKGILTVPMQAIFEDDNGNDIVYRVKNDSITDKQIVKTGINDFEKVEILEGLSLNDTISLQPPEKKLSEKKETNIKRGKLRRG